MRRHMQQVTKLEGRTKLDPIMAIYEIFNDYTSTTSPTLSRSPNQFKLHQALHVDLLPLQSLRAIRHRRGKRRGARLMDTDEAMNDADTPHLHLHHHMQGEAKRRLKTTTTTAESEVLQQARLAEVIN